jgi:glutathione S-transferase
LPARIVAIDLARKPASFLQLSPEGKVPMLTHGAGAVSDSAVINEYLEDAFPVVAMLPRDALLRARARTWIRFADARLYEHTSQLLHSPDPAVHARSLAAIEEDLSYIEDHAFASGHAGPYWMGAQFTLVDAALYALVRAGCCACKPSSAFMAGAVPGPWRAGATRWLPAHPCRYRAIG